MDPEVEALYGLPLDEFTRARDALARTLAKAGGAEAAAAVKALRKPSVVTWALNQLARRHPEELPALLDAGSRLRRAQTATLEGGDPDELRDATKAEAAAVHVLAARARALLAEAGRGGSSAHEDRLAATLRAAAVDTEAGDRLRRGVLTEELSPAGFGFGVAEEPFPADPPGPLATRPRRSPVPPSRDRQAPAREPRPRQQEPPSRERERREQLRTAEEDVRRLDRDAAAAEDRAREARAAAAAAEDRAREARAAAIEAAARAEALARAATTGDG